MIGILSSIAILNFMTAADKETKEATGIVSALVKAATAYQTEYVLPVDAGELSEYAKFQECIGYDVATREELHAKLMLSASVVQAVVNSYSVLHYFW